MIDHAYINDKGQIIGGSYNPGFIVTGNVDSHEHVVVDFSTIKKDIKNLIDRHVSDFYANGFDHKLWFIEGYSLGTIGADAPKDSTTVVIDTPAASLQIQRDALKIIRNNINNTNSTYSVQYIGYALESYLTELLTEQYPNINVNVQCFNNTHIHTIDQNCPLLYFTYSHGLKDSTSYGCQNIAHGHLSFFQHHNPTVVLSVCVELDGTVFINKENIVNDDDEAITIKYVSERGLFFAKYNKQLNKIIVLDTETTIEYIAEYVKDKYAISDFYISEGLSKGTYIK